MKVYFIELSILHQSKDFCKLHNQNWQHNKGYSDNIMWNSELYQSKKCG